MLIELDTIDLVLTMVLIVVALSVSRWQQLGLEGQLFFSAIRAFLQLIAVGYILELVFTLETVWGVLAVLCVMVGIATTVTKNRISQKLSQLFWWVGGSLLLTTSLTLGYVVMFIVQPSIWYDPQYWIPLAGIIIGNAVNGATIAGERLINAIENNRGEIETHLCLGATPKSAIEPYRRQAIRAGILPNLNQMALVGIVTLPGILTGQLLGGVNPLNAVSYQILILFSLVFANLLTTSLITVAIYRQFFTPEAQLR
ncbi:ABC transporter permease [Dactylococcopsis salina]|uniref:TIGR00245 family protein n=1 Tax=Dactylococcopsis salina (strain PCC 8305) TaxID=13035 RepID=K9YR71_DACS8|nr:iron export ABC transporter permease subunit FetB [Dactylococcopsis salina]AFZ48855.1 TIGR00245 family protein [Dactylococcopsis salina PCC 8305]